MSEHRPPELGCADCSFAIQSNLTNCERDWLRFALDCLVKIDENRARGAPRNSAFCIFEIGIVYVQFSASFERNDFYCEAVSSKFVPAIAEILNPDILFKFGFEPPGKSLNYSRRVPARSIEDLHRVALLAFETLQFAYRVINFAPATFTLNVPGFK